MAQATLELDSSEPGRAVEPLVELGSYEVLWADPKASFKSVADRFAQSEGALPSDFVPRGEALKMASVVLSSIRSRGVHQFGVRVHGAGEYPTKLRDARHPVELLYYRGWWNLVEKPSVAVVGTRKPTDEGLRRTRKLVRQLAEDGWLIVSGLAAGVDTAAHLTALEVSGESIAVVGTPVCEVYPRENAGLQAHLARNCLVVSQVPVFRYYQQTWVSNRSFFPERNITMSALTQATIIVEASDTSGTLTQARAALHQKRHLFILASCFNNPKIKWPARFAERGAIRVDTYDDIRRVLGAPHKD